MGIWIRSQNKEALTNCTALDVAYKRSIENKDTDYLIIDKSTGYVLGTYGTKERAIEVLGEIQLHIESAEYLKVRPEAWQGELFVFQMPQE